MNCIRIDMIERYIKDNNLTRKDFCKNCKISYESFLKIMRNQSDVNIRIVFKIARGMGLKHVCELFSDEKPSKKE